MSEPRFYDLVMELDRIRVASPDEERVARFAQLTKDAALYQYAFDRLDDPAWIVPLRAKGFFSTPPQPIHDPTKGTIGFPLWPESRYLARMAARAPEAVLEVALQIPDTDNVRVHEDFVDAALQMPAALGARLVPKAKKWIELPYQMLLPEKLGALVGHLAKGGQVKAALDLARALLVVLPDPRAAEKTGEEETYRLSPEPRARFDTWEYKETIEKNLPDLVAAAGEKALALFCELLDSAIRLSSRHGDSEGPEDYSYIWRPTIEDHEQNHPHGLRDFLITAVRDAAEQITKADPSQVPALVEKLEQQPWLVFRRIALHLLRVCPDGASALIAKRLTDRASFDEEGLWHEYILLARDHFAHLSPDDQTTILNWIAAGPGLDQFKTTQELLTDKRPTDEEAKRYARYWQLESLSPLHDVLPPEWRQRYDELVAELGEPEHPEFVSYTSGGWVGPTSPKSDEDLRLMSVQEIITFLKDWQPSRDPRSPSPEGLGRELTVLVASDPERFASRAEQFQELDPTYVHALLTGLRDAAKEKRAFSWPLVLELCSWVMKQPREIPGRKSKYSDLDPGWVWTRKTIADLLSSGFEVGPAEIPFDFRNSAWDVLKPITDDPEPTQEYEARYGGSNMDPATLSINTTRGGSMHAVVRYALWVRRHIEKTLNGKERIERGFKEMPEVQEILNAHLDPAQDTSLAVRSVYGQWFPWLVLLDREWATAHFPKIFPQDESLRDLRDAAWETYIIFCAPYDEVFEVLREEYGRAIERIGTGSTQRRHLATPDERLAEHLMILYRRRKLALDEPNSLLVRFYARASDALCGHTFSTEGRRLYNTKETIPSEILGRLKALWERRLAAARVDMSPASHAAELAAFGWWFASAKFDDAWAMTQLSEILRLVGKVDADRRVVERLAVLAVDMPRQTVKCLHRIVEGDEKRWNILGWREHARMILAAAIQGSDSEARQAAVDLVHRLGARGYLEFRDLLQEGPSS